MDKLNWVVITKTVEDSDKLAIDLIYCNKTKKDILLKQELDEISESEENINTTYITEDSVGLVSFHDINIKVTDLSNSRFFICGKEGFRNHVLKLLDTYYNIKPSSEDKQIFIF